MVDYYEGHLKDTSTFAVTFYFDIPYNFIFEKYYIPVRIKSDVAKEAFRSTVLLCFVFPKIFYFYAHFQKLYQFYLICYDQYIYNRSITVVCRLDLHHKSDR